MKVIGLDGKTYHFKVVNHATENCSDLHRKAKEILLDLYPFTNIYEEVSLPGSNGLTVDFYLPQHNLFIEVHGKQHYEQTNFFHKDISGYIRSIQRDKRKREWAELNGIDLVELPYDRIPEWTNLILQR